MAVETGATCGNYLVEEIPRVSGERGSGAEHDRNSRVSALLYSRYGRRTKRLVRDWVEGDFLSSRLERKIKGLSRRGSTYLGWCTGEVGVGVERGYGAENDGNSGEYSIGE